MFVKCRTILVTVAGVFGGDPLIEIMLATFIIASATFAQLAWKPYSSQLLNRVESTGLLVAFSIQLLSIM